MNMIPIEDRIVLKAIDAADTTTGGVILPDMQQEGSIVTEVVAVGPGRYGQDGTLIKPISKVGDKVVIRKYGAFSVELEDQEYLVIRESETLMILENK
tara:strand:- start:343 stop:636 length:294 start_codon:yes stop_codon:yes gene_type:complete